MESIHKIIISLLVLALFLGGTIEISEGSIILGVLWILLALILIAVLSFKSTNKSDAIKASIPYLLIGSAIVLSDIAFNLQTASKLGTLDIMTFVFGASLIALGLKNSDARRMGTFTAYMSATFLVLFLIFFSLFGRLQIDFTHIFDHYFVLTPVVFILHLLGYPVEVIGTETVRMNGVEEMNVVIGGPCSGLYSMFMLIGIIVGYIKLENMRSGKVYSMILITAVVAYIANLARITVLYIAGYHYGRDAMMFVHTHLGWIIFVVVAGVLIYILNEMALRQH